MTPANRRGSGTETAGRARGGESARRRRSDWARLLSMPAAGPTPSRWPGVAWPGAAVQPVMAAGVGGYGALWGPGPDAFPAAGGAVLLPQHPRVPHTWAWGCPGLAQGLRWGSCCPHHSPRLLLGREAPQSSLVSRSEALVYVGHTPRGHEGVGLEQPCCLLKLCSPGLICQWHECPVSA